VSRGVTDPAVARIAGTAAGYDDLGGLADIVRSCVACPELAATRTSVVVGDIPPEPRFLLVGEAPGAQEDLAGRPFVGKSGQLLDELMAEAGLARADAAVLNICKCRPPGNRPPSRAEALRCAGWLDRQVELIDPPIVVTLGRTALTWALGARLTLADVRGSVHDWRGRRLIASYHPSAAIRFGPRGMPRAALRDDLALLARTLA
jgi:uracil-DNA glycosylase family 4